MGTIAVEAVKIVGGNGDRHKLDFYPTPTEVTHALIDFLESECLLNRRYSIWECACGDGAMSKVFKERGYDVYETDINKGIDFLTASFDGFCDWIITNPPFNRSVEFIEHADTLNKPFAFLLKAQYWNSAKRLSLFEKHPPAFVLPLTWRPDFTGQGSSLMDMMWCVWFPEVHRTLYFPLRKPKKGAT